jgi:phospholipid transport system substrate-binding protein
MECIDRFHAVLLDVMKNAKTLGYDGRFQELEPAVKDAYNLSFMARKSIGRHWKSLSDADRKRFLDLFTGLTVANYAGRFTGWSGESFETLGEEPGVHDTMLVKSRIVRPDDEDVTLDYRLQLTPDHGWQIIDVYMNGTISELALRRSEYSAMLRREGFPALVEALDKKITDLREG